MTVEWALRRAPASPLKLLVQGQTLPCFRFISTLSSPHSLNRSKKAPLHQTSSLVGSWNRTVGSRDMGLKLDHIAGDLKFQRN